MIIAETIQEVRKQVREWKKQGLSVGLVPTMGALHDGHGSLVTTAVGECDRVVVSIFVNPTQFAANEDLDSYPRNFEKDCCLLEEKGCHMVFHPDVKEMYPDGFATYVDLESDMTKQLCGKSRATHFKGVCTVVSKLFHIAEPDKAFFGEKDAQQLAVIRKMVRDQAFGLEIVGCPTMREPDGLARSSRNAYLNEEERKAAGVLYKAIAAAEKSILEYKEKGLKDNYPEPSEIVELMRGVIGEEPMARIEYIDVVDGITLLPAETMVKGTLVALAVHIGKTRLIDNFTVK